MTRIAEFWGWFRENEERFRNLDGPDRDALLDELQTHLQEVHPGIWFEVGSHPDGTNELVLTAEGKVDVFPVIRDLARSWPEIPGWEVTQFKPAMGFDFTTEYGGVTVSPESSWFLPLVSKKDPNALGLRVAFSHFDPANEDAFHYAAVLMLEGGLGELAFATHIQYLEVCLAPSIPDAEGYISVPSLPDYLRETGRAVGA